MNEVYKSIHSCQETWKQDDLTWLHSTQSSDQVAYTVCQQPAVCLQLLRAHKAITWQQLHTNLALEILDYTQPTHDGLRAPYQAAATQLLLNTIENQEQKRQDHHKLPYLQCTWAGLVLLSMDGTSHLSTFANSSCSTSSKQQIHDAHFHASCVEPD